ncbi:MAG TPA: hypothetical protein PLP33_29475 [Leptospiraceae bacterium]|nr:hypothetical protein [Leptospiraceae bacterium]
MCQNCKSLIQKDLAASNAASRKVYLFISSDMPSEFSDIKQTIDYSVNLMCNLWFTYAAGLLAIILFID